MPAVRSLLETDTVRGAVTQAEALYTAPLVQSVLSNALILAKKAKTQLPKSVESVIDTIAAVDADTLVTQLDNRVDGVLSDVDAYKNQLRSTIDSAVVDVDAYKNQLRSTIDSAVENRTSELASLMEGTVDYVMPDVKTDSDSSNTENVAPNVAASTKATKKSARQRIVAVPRTVSKRAARRANDALKSLEGIDLEALRRRTIDPFRPLVHVDLIKYANDVSQSRERIATYVQQQLCDARVTGTNVANAYTSRLTAALTDFDLSHVQARLKSVDTRLGTSFGELDLQGYSRMSLQHVSHGANGVRMRVDQLQALVHDHLNRFHSAAGELFASSNAVLRARVAAAAGAMVEAKIQAGVVADDARDKIGHYGAYGAELTRRVAQSNAMAVIGRVAASLGCPPQLPLLILTEARSRAARAAAAPQAIVQHTRQLLAPVLARVHDVRGSAEAMVTYALAALGLADTASATPLAGTAEAVTQAVGETGGEANGEANGETDGNAEHETSVAGLDAVPVRERAPSPIADEMLLEQKRQQRKQHKQHKQRSGSRSKRRPKAGATSDDRA